MEVHKNFIVYTLNNVMIEKVCFKNVSNIFDTEEEAIQALVDENMTYEEFIIVKRVYIN